MVWTHVLQKGWRRVIRYQRGNQNRYIEEEQTTQCPKEQVQKDKQRSTKHTHKTKDRVTPTPLKTGGEPRCSGRISSSCSTIDTRRVRWDILIHSHLIKELIYILLVWRRKMENKIYHTVGTVINSDGKTKNTTLSEQL